LYSAGSRYRRDYDPLGGADSGAGELRLALSLLAIYLVTTVIRNIIEPKIVGGQLGVYPVITLASMFTGVQLFGVVGLFGFPIALSLMMYPNKNGVINWFI